ncbi:hypothetical protein ACQR35_07900 [Pseudarthrobacter sp. J1738]|uniref:hypothetical protein n=1 Tax=unclassified Pseudarthrobacter TaxID=2647000 RepID=UPI003D28D851
MSWIFWVIILSWVVPLVMRTIRKSQGAQRPQNLPPSFPNTNRPPHPTSPNGQGTQQSYNQGYMSPLPDQDSYGQQSYGQPVNNQPPVASTPNEAGTASAGGFRARRLAELDAQFSDGKIAMEDYMAQRAEIMRG